VQVVEHEQDRARRGVPGEALLDEGEERSYLLGRLVVRQREVVQRERLTALQRLQKRLER
jgi:hypothetical protein